MIIRGILSRRWKTKLPYYDIVYRWEDEISRALNVPIKKERFIDSWPQKLINLSIKTKALNRFADVIYGRKKKYLRFVMSATDYNHIYNHPSCIPVIIDFFLKNDNQIKEFIYLFRNVEYMLITSKCVYDILLTYKTPFKLIYFPVTVSDSSISRLRIDDKKYDLVLTGRQSDDPFWKRMVEKYDSKHPEFTYVYREKLKYGQKEQYIYVTNRGDIVCDDNFNDYDGYLNVVRLARIGVYSTPTLSGKKGTNGYDQVTPRFLELIASYCHTLLHYPNNGDTIDFEFSRFSSNITNYEEFERELDKRLKSPVDILFYDGYLKKHCTSSLIHILETL